MMINPRQIRTRSEKFTFRSTGKKLYRTGFLMRNIEQFSRQSFRTASEAHDYGVRVVLRWQRLYDAEIKRMSQIVEREA